MSSARTIHKNETQENRKKEIHEIGPEYIFMIYLNNNEKHINEDEKRVY